jgi:predicted O-methyltransferase YrrM
MAAKDVLKEIEEAAPRENLPILGSEKGKLIEDLIMKHRPVSAVEIGTLVGYSAITIASHLPQEGSLTCLEISQAFATRALINIKKANLSSKVRVIVGDARRTLTDLKPPVDFLLIDASKPEYLQFLKASEPLLHPGSVVVADNVKVFAHEVQDYLAYVKNSREYSSRTVEAPLAADGSVTDAMEISIKI